MMWEEREMERERDGEAVLRQTKRATEDALRRRNDRSSSGEETSDAIPSPKIRRGVKQQMQVFDHSAVAGFTCSSDVFSNQSLHWQDWLNSFTDKPTVWNAIIH